VIIGEWREKRKAKKCKSARGSEIRKKKLTQRRGESRRNARQEEEFTTELTEEKREQGEEAAIG